MENSVDEEIEPSSDKKTSSDKKPSSLDLMSLDNEIKILTHTELDPTYVGNIEEISTEVCTTSLVTAAFMVADAERMVHSGFIGSAAEYAALLVVNEANGMIYSVSSQYFACARVGDEIKYKATVKHSDSRKREVTVVAKIDAIKIYEGKITIIIPEYHPLKIHLLDVANANKKSL